MRRILAVVIVLVALATFSFAIRSKSPKGTETSALASATPTPTPPPVKIVSGVVRRDGTSIGQGFTVVHITTSRYSVSFNSAFDDIPAVVVQHLWDVGNPTNFGGAAMDTCTVEGVNASSFGVVCVNNKGQAEDRSFSFIAVRSR